MDKQTERTKTTGVLAELLLGVFSLWAMHECFDRGDYHLGILFLIIFPFTVLAAIGISKSFEEEPPIPEAKVTNG